MNLLLIIDPNDGERVHCYERMKSTYGAHLRFVMTMFAEDVQGIMGAEILTQLRDAGNTGVWVTIKMEVNE